MGSVCLLSSWQFPTGPILFSKYGTENPGEEKSVFSLSGGQQTDQCVVASAQLTEAQRARLRLSPSSYLPFRYQTDARTQPGQRSWLLTGRL